MKENFLSLGVVFLILFGSIGGITQQGAPPDEININNYEYVEDQLLVSFKPTVGSERASQVLSDLGVEHVRKLKQIGVDVVKLPKGLTVEKALEIFNHRPEVSYAEPNYLLEIASNLEVEVTDQWGLEKIEAPQAWGEVPIHNPVVIAVVDTGVDFSVPDLTGKMWENQDEIPGNGLDDDNNQLVDDTWGWDFVNGDNDPTDDHYHGTAVSSVAAGSLNGTDVAGVCPWCEIMAVKVITAEGSGSLDQVASGIMYAADQGAQVINLSLASPPSPLGEFLMQSLKTAVNYAWDAGVLVVAAAGNDGIETLAYPAAFEHAMSVASTDIDDHHSCYSNYSDGFITVSAPGENIPFAYLPGGIAYGSGTSLSAPHVAGLAGLLLSQDPGRTNQDLWNIIENTTNDLGPTGTDGFFGTGRINAYRAVMGDTTPTAPPDEDYVLVDDATGYPHARKIVRSADGTLHRVWHDKSGSDYLVLYAYSADDGMTWSQPETIFSTPAETYHPAITLDKDTLYVVFPTMSGAYNYQIAFSSKPISGGSWSYPASLMGGSYNAVRPDIYLDPSTQRLHVVASSFDDAKYVYYRTSADGGQHWDPVRNVDFINNTRYASVYAYGDNVYIASRTMEDGFLAPIFRVVTMRSLNGGTTWQDRTLLAEHSALTSSEYGLTLTGFEGTMFMLYENNQKIIFNKSTNGAYWDQVILYSQGEGKWPTITASPDGRAWASWLNASGVVEMREYLGGSLQSIGSYGPVEALYAATYPNFKEGTNFGKVEWVTTSCNAAPFAISLDSKTAGVNTPPYAFFDAPADAQAGSPVLFDAAASYDMDGDSLVYNWDFGDGNTGNSVTPSHNYQSGGSYTVTLTVDDGHGGSDTTSAQVEVTAAPNNPPTADIGGPYSGVEGVPISFDGSQSSDSDGDLLTFSWDFGDGNSGTGATPSHAFTSAGTYTVSLTVDDGNGSSDTDTTQVEVTAAPNNPPTADIGGPYSGAEGVPISFDGSQSSDPDGDLLTFSWDFGDGNSGTGATPSHTYASAGDYTVSLTVDDGNGGSDMVTTTASISTAGQSSVHIGDLDASRTPIRNKWVAIVIIQVHDDQHNPVEFATVSGTWSAGASGTDSCTTDASGLCTITTLEILKKIPSVNFTVDDISHATLSYDAALNHDSEEDSDGNSIIVYLDPVTEPTPTPEPSPTPPPSGDSSLHIADLEGTGTPVRSKWEAVVEILVHDQDETPKAGVTVTGTWSAGGEASCVTGEFGTCTVTKNNLKMDVSPVTFTITDATLSGYTYAFDENHDLDDDTDGTTIVIDAPPLN